MRTRRGSAVLLGSIAIFALTGCAGRGEDRGAATTTSSAGPIGTEVDDQVQGIIALGHSGLTGEGTGGPARAYSWATGDDPAVMSIYQRMIATWPDTDGQVFNAAEGGAPAAALERQAQRALQEVPRPRLVVVQSIDGDIRCDGTDGTHVVEFGEDLANALRAVTTASPESRILVIGQPGRPGTYAEAIAGDASAVRANSGNGMCDPFDSSGAQSPDSLDALTGIIEAYEAEQARVCAEFSQCTTDDGVAAAFEDRIEDFAGNGDWGHRNVTGQARLAEALWPVVAAFLAD